MYLLHHPHFLKMYLVHILEVCIILRGFKMRPLNLQLPEEALVVEHLPS